MPLQLIENIFFDAHERILEENIFNCKLNEKITGQISDIMAAGNQWKLERNNLFLEFWHPEVDRHTLPHVASP